MQPTDIGNLLQADTANPHRQGLYSGQLQGAAHSTGMAQTRTLVAITHIGVGIECHQSNRLPASHILDGAQAGRRQRMFAADGNGNLPTAHDTSDGSRCRRQRAFVRHALETEHWVGGDAHAERLLAELLIIDFQLGRRSEQSRRTIACPLTIARGILQWRRNNNDARLSQVRIPVRWLGKVGDG